MVEVGILGESLEWAVERATAAGNKSACRLLGQPDVIIGAVEGASQESGAHLWEERGCGTMKSAMLGLLTPRSQKQVEILEISLAICTM